MTLAITDDELRMIIIRRCETASKSGDDPKKMIAEVKRIADLTAEYEARTKAKS
jgi:hypothetical protein